MIIDPLIKNKMKQEIDRRLGKDIPYKLEKYKVYSTATKEYIEYVN